MPGPPRFIVAISLAAVLVLAATRGLQSGAYRFAGDTFGLDVITHPQGYTGTGGPLNISVAIDPTSPNASSMETSVENIVNTVDVAGGSEHRGGDAAGYELRRGAANPQPRRCGDVAHRDGGSR